MATRPSGSSNGSSPEPVRSLCAEAQGESRIANDLATVREAVGAAMGPRLEALLLVGAYARGEGSIVAEGNQFVPCDGYELVAVVRSPAALARRRLAQVAERVRRQIGVRVGLQPVSRPGFDSLPRTLFWYDVSRGPLELVAGDNQARIQLQRSLVSRLRFGIPLDEAGRLLANRAAGIALSNLATSGDDRRDVRHGHLAVMAAGDALLLAADRYQPTLSGRLAALESLAGAPAVTSELLERYRAAVSFQRRPDLWKPEANCVREWLQALVPSLERWHLDFEWWRVGAPTDAEAFAQWRGQLYPQADDMRAGQIASALVAIARRRAPVLPYVGHPRERLARVAVALGYGCAEPRCRRIAADLLGISGNPKAISNAHAQLRWGLLRLIAEAG